MNEQNGDMNQVFRLQSDVSLLPCYLLSAIGIFHFFLDPGDISFIIIFSLRDLTNAHQDLATPHLVSFSTGVLFMFFHILT